MRTAADWVDYRLIGCSRGERLERWGDKILVRPDPQVIWDTPRDHPGWQAHDARYIRSDKGGGRWTENALPERWQVSRKNLRFQVGLMNFKHVGLFPEQAANWDLMAGMSQGRPVSALNLFAYTGAATVALAEAGAAVCHVDAAKGMCSWARENAALSGVSEKPIRWIVDDCVKFVEREIRRGSRYDAIVMDPPSYGRGPGGEVWKLEDGIYALVTQAARLLSDDPCFFLLNSYTAGLSASVTAYLLDVAVRRERGGRVTADELGLPVEESGMTLPCGSTAIWTP